MSWREIRAWERLRESKKASREWKHRKLRCEDPMDLAEKSLAETHEILRLQETNQQWEAGEPERKRKHEEILRRLRGE